MALSRWLMIRLTLVLQVNTFMKQLHPLNTITVDFKSNCQDETEVTLYD